MRQEAPLDTAEPALEAPAEAEDAEAVEDTNTTSIPKRSSAPRKKKRAGLVAVARVIDGDTIELADGRRVRLVQIDAPEVGDGECFAGEATDALAGLLVRGSRVRLEADPRLDREDRYGRLLRYVFSQRTNVNVALVRRGAASVWFFQGDQGRSARRLLAAARSALRPAGSLGRVPGHAPRPVRSRRDEPRPAGPGLGGRRRRRLRVTDRDGVYTTTSSMKSVSRHSPVAKSLHAARMTPTGRKPAFS